MVYIEKRKIIIPSNERCIGVQNDNEVETRIFCLNRFYESIDLAEYSAVMEVEPININNPCYYNILTKEVTEDKIYLYWVVKSHDTVDSGALNFSINFSKFNEDNTSMYVFQTFQEHFHIAVNIQSEQEAIIIAPDIFEQAVNMAVDNAQIAEQQAQLAIRQAQISTEQAQIAKQQAQIATEEAIVATEMNNEIIDKLIEFENEFINLSHMGNYDKNKNGIVDNSERLGGLLPEEYVTTYELETQIEEYITENLETQIEEYITENLETYLDDELVTVEKLETRLKKNLDNNGLDGYVYTRIYVSCTIGNDETGDGSEEFPYGSVNKVLDTLPKNLGGERIIIDVADGKYIVAGSEYQETQNIYVSHFFNGQLLIQGSANVFKSSPIFYSLSIYNCVNIHVEGISFYNVSVLNTEFCYLKYLYMLTNIGTIDGEPIKRGRGMSISSSNVHVRDNMFENKESAIGVSTCSIAYIDSCTYLNCDVGVWVDSGSILFHTNPWWLNTRVEVSVSDSACAFVDGKLIGESIINKEPIDIYIHVDINSTFTIEDGSQANPFTSFAKAVKAIPTDLKFNSYTIKVASGTYQEKIDIPYTVNGTFTVEGATRDSVYFYSISCYGSATVKNINCKYVYASGLHNLLLSNVIINNQFDADGNPTFNSGIFAWGTTIRLSGDTEIRNHNKGVYAYELATIVASDCLIYASEAGFVADNSIIMVASPTEGEYLFSMIHGVSINAPTRYIEYNGGRYFDSQNKNNTPPVSVEPIYNILDGTATGSVRTIGSNDTSDKGLLGEYAFGEGLDTTAMGKASHAEGYDTCADGQYSHAEGWLAYAEGEGSHAEGYFTYAEGSYSHVEGYRSYAEGNYSHAEGNSYAEGEHSHSEGHGTYTSGIASHAEGDDTTAQGDYSHAEGNSTWAEGTSSHAEGEYTEAIGEFSHTQNFKTEAQGYAQTVLGMYNIPQGTPTERVDTDYALIVGNGLPQPDQLYNALIRSNALTLTWDGVLDVAKGVTVNGVPIGSSIESIPNQEIINLI